MRILNQVYRVFLQNQSTKICQSSKRRGTVSTNVSRSNFSIPCDSGSGNGTGVAWGTGVHTELWDAEKSDLL